MTFGQRGKTNFFKVIGIKKIDFEFRRQKKLSHI